MDYTYLQENGQMKYGGPPPGWYGPVPPKGTEVFVSRLPRDATLSDICPVFERAGEIYSARLMMDFSGTNRGFCFIQYFNKADARTAISMLNNYEIESGHHISVSKSIDNCRLFIGQIPKNIKKEEIKEVLDSITSGVKDVILYLSPTNKSINRGFCFVEYVDHRSAAMARRSLIAGGIPNWGREVRIDWAIPEDDIDESVMSEVTVVYVRNLMLRTTEATLREAVCKAINTEDITRIRKVKDFAFLHFRTREAAEMALKHLDGFQLDGARLTAMWAKPNPVGDLSSECSDLEYFKHQKPLKMQLTLVKKDKRKKKSEPKKYFPKKEVNAFGDDLTKEFQHMNIHNEDQSMVTCNGNNNLFISTNVSTSISPVIHYSPDMVIPLNGYPPSPYPVNSLTLVPFVCPPLSFYNDQSIKHFVESIMKTNHPAAALRCILPAIGWGEVYFSVSFELDQNSITIFNAQIFIIKPDRTVQYPPVHHPPAYTSYDAKNLAAYVFIRSYLLGDKNSQKILY